ncbi:MAG: response regulator [Deltaproteobacteria bacterium]|nr:response regulator [Deltaproteobacteria bacterium]
MALKYKHTLLFVDDEKSITKALHRLFRKDGYHIITASSGMEGLELLEKAERPVSLIISDQRMSGMNGAQFLEKAKKIFPDAVRFLLTGYSDMDAVVEAVNKGEIHRYLTKPWNDDDLLLQVRQSLKQLELVIENRRLLKLTNKQNKELDELNKSLGKKVELRTLEIRQKNVELEKSFVDTIRLLSSLIGTLKPKLGKYMGYVAQLARELAEDFQIDKEELDQIEMAGMIHDIGLLGLPDDILTIDEDHMDTEQLKIFMQHPVIASTCLESVERLNRVGEIILYHHEHVDGTGFPAGLKRDNIPLGSRIIGAVADYCKIVCTWPKDPEKIKQRARQYFGSAIKDIDNSEPEKMLEKIGQKIILLQANQKYDMDVVVNLVKKVKEPAEVKEVKKQKGKGVVKVGFEDLKEGMVLVTDLRLKDGRLLLVKGTKLKNSSIKTVQIIGERKLLDGQIFVSV